MFYINHRLIHGLIATAYLGSSFGVSKTLVGLALFALYALLAGEK